MSHAIELLGGGHARRARADHGHALAGAVLRRLGQRPNPLEMASSAIDFSISLMATGSSIDAEHARGFARRRAYAPSDLREVVGLVQRAGRLLPFVAVNVIVPVGDQVTQRTAGVAERNAAIHAAGALRLQLLAHHGQLELAVVFDALAHRDLARIFAAILHETSDFSHDLALCLP